MNRVSVIAIVVALASTAGCPNANAERVASVTALTPNVDNGKVLHETHCVTCHGADGRTGTANEDTVDDAVNNADVCFDYLIDGDTGIPGFGDTFTDQELADVWGSVKSLQYAASDVTRSRLRDRADVVVVAIERVEGKMMFKSPPRDGVRKRRPPCRARQPASAGHARDARRRRQYGAVE